jgi:predicted site-specific integrase-resolvase
MSSDYLDARALADRFHVTPPTILRWARAGMIPCLRAGRRPVLFDPEQVEQALRARGAQRAERLDSGAGPLHRSPSRQEVRHGPA